MAELKSTSFALYKPIHRALKMSALNSEEEFGRVMTLQEIVNRILAAHFQIPFETLVNGNEKGLADIPIFKERQSSEPLQNRRGEEPLTPEEIIEDHILKDMKEHECTTLEERARRVRILQYPEWYNTPLSQRSQDEILEFRESQQEDS